MRTRLLFLLVVTPAGVLGRPIWRRRLGLSRAAGTRSYWRRRDGRPVTAADLRRSP